MDTILQLIFNNSTYSTIITILAIALIILSMYNRIKYLCLKKAAEKVAEVEKMSELTGEQKFALVVTWIDDELPKVFKTSLGKTLIEKLVQYAYDNSFNYAKNYIKRKTGVDISELVNQVQNQVSTSSTES